MKYIHSSAYAIIHAFALTRGGGQGRSTIKVLEVLRHKLGLCDVEEDRKDETTKLHTFGVILLRCTPNTVKVIG